MSNFQIQKGEPDSPISDEGIITFPDGAPLPTGWTQDGSDPANVETNGGFIDGTVGDGAGQPGLKVSGNQGWGLNLIGVGSSGNALAGTYITGTGDEGVVIKGTGSVYNGILIQGQSTESGQADIILDANGNQGILLQNIPTSDPAVAGWLYNDSGTLKISAG